VTGPVGTPVPADHPAPALPEVVGLARAAEDAGFTSLWVADDLDAARARADAFSILGALATATRHARLGTLPVSGPARAPAILAKIVSTVDVLSGGRAVLSLPARPEEGGPTPVALAEALRVCRAVLDDTQPVIDGAVYRVDRPVNRPAPVAEGGVPVAVRLEDVAAGPSDGDRTLDTVARAADLALVDAEAGADGSVRVPTVLERLRSPGAGAEAGRRADGLVILTVVAPPAGLVGREGGGVRRWCDGLLRSLPGRDDGGAGPDGILVDLSALTAPPAELGALVTALGSALGR
jgi:alkanesulfonate monooxygenase SsuD/methylene tetrahydromethanopterin reductase-like flavin-dependent oxidoreductase (luciferase family)